MKETLYYKGYSAKIRFDAEEEELVGEVEGINDLIVFSSKNCDVIEQYFHESVDGYLEACKEANKSPNKAYSGSFNIRISPEAHQKLDALASEEDTTLNSQISNAINRYLDDKSELLVFDAISSGLLHSWPAINNTMVRLPPSSSAEANHSIAHIAGERNKEPKQNDCAKA